LTDLLCLPALHVLIQESQYFVESVVYQAIVHLVVKAVPASGHRNEFMIDLVSG
jgi:hypothetical protein